MAVLYAALALLIATAAAVVFTSNMLHCVVLACVLSALSALAFLFVGAPDVALAEVVIGSTLTTIVYLTALRRHSYLASVEKKEEGAGSIREAAPNRARFLAPAVLVCFAAALIGGSALLGAPKEPTLKAEILTLGFAEAGAKNLVTAIYLDFRIFDTLFEALLLMVSVIGVTQFSMPDGRAYGSESAGRGAGEERKAGDGKLPGTSGVLSGSLPAVYPFIALLGFYITVSGASGPGGGFQGGALLSAILISVHFVSGRKVLKEHALEVIEKCSYVLILVSVSVFLMLHAKFGEMEHQLYFLIMNVLIAAKVFSGVTLIYLLFRKSGAANRDESAVPQGRNADRG